MPELTITPVSQSVKASSCTLPPLHHFDDGQVKLPGEFPVSGIVGRHRHDGAGPVGNQHIVRDKDRNFLPGQRVDCGNPFKLYAGFFLGKLRALKIGFLCRLLLIRTHCIQVLQLILPFFKIGCSGETTI